MIVYLINIEFIWCFLWGSTYSYTLGGGKLIYATYCRGGEKQEKTPNSAITSDGSTDSYGKDIKDWSLLAVEMVCWKYKTSSVVAAPSTTPNRTHTTGSPRRGRQCQWVAKLRSERPLITGRACGEGYSEAMRELRLIKKFTEPSKYFEQNGLTIN